jgi:hypothetical protein
VDSFLETTVNARVGQEVLGLHLPHTKYMNLNFVFLMHDFDIFILFPTKKRK